MRDHRPSRTAIAVAILRAAHQLVDSPLIFEDPLALQILRPYADKVRDAARKDRPQLFLRGRMLRLFAAVRSRFSEDELAKAVARGVGQYVLMGAGLDTFAYRNPHPGLRVFEVDHPATQRWKRSLLEDTGIAVPRETVFVPVNFERDSLPRKLAEAGFRADEPAFFSWLGVVPYLTEDAFVSTVKLIASMPEGSGVVFDYAADKSKLGLMERSSRNLIAWYVARAGEPLRLFFDPVKLSARITAMGFRYVENLSSNEINARYCLEGRSRLQLRGLRIISARI